MEPGFRDNILSKTIKVIVIIIYINSCASKEIIRETKFGKVRGYSSLSSQIFTGIPYAAPSKRWEAPTSPGPWNGTLDATKLKPMCYQAENCAAVNPVGTCQAEVSEDCLYLNIFAPLDTTKRSRKAVMLFIHGGGFEFSSGGADVYNGEAISSKGDVIIVTFNYRLGAFGFLVTGDGNNDITGNYGILDQIQALNWVHENIGDFGGDNNRITLFGQSAGALSIATHMTSRSLAHLFHRVIIESSPFTIPLKPMDVAVSQGKDFARLLNCSARNVSCLRSKSASAIATAQGIYFQQAMFSDSYLRKFLPWIPHIDGITIINGVIEAFSSRSFVPKATIIGSTSEEGQMYVYLGFGKPMSALEYRILLIGVRPNHSSRVYKMYKPTNTSDARARLAELTTDFVFYCSTRAVARSISQFAPVNLITLYTPDLITLDTPDLIILHTTDLITLDTPYLITLDTPDLITLDTSDLITLDIPDQITLDTPDLITLDTPYLIILDTPDLITLDTSDLITLGIPDLITLDTPDLITLDIPDLITLDTPDLITLDIPDLITLNIPDLITLDTPDLITLDIPNLITLDTPDVIIVDTPEASQT
ncbi:cAMP-regulated D2 protein-like [Mercenaria mercenaria]|uniref:cAMP-regulated D2 protein-like n=1 Tax=Mercenaria mercenaria TaxID=6596 RepID=UPI00234E5CF9|nr:cAMP-regulated D2 protein-like [Mercenaria mercenaria]